MRGLFLAVILAAVASRAGAEEASPASAVLAAPDGGVVISSTLCPALATSLPSADYVPGVDAQGRAVAPADLPRAAPPLKLEDFPIEIDAHLAGRFGVPARGGAFSGKAILGYVAVKDGKAYFNGQPLAEDASTAIVAACRAAKR